MNNTFVDVAVETLRAEAEHLRHLAETVDTEAMAKAVALIAASKGRVVTSGIGKSAIIAQKISATLNSTGTASLYMHAADATHGDLGALLPDDVVIILSKSGNTAEIAHIASIVKRLFGNPIIAITANASSALARESDIVLHTPMSAEADPNDLAPTSSAILQMAMGDALAMALMVARNFSRNDFSRNHPGGHLGKQLLLRAADIAERNPRPCVDVDTPLAELILCISSGRMGAAVVLSANEIVGIVTDGDLRRFLENHIDIRAFKAGDLMSRAPKIIHPDTLARECMDIIRRHKITQLIVAEDVHHFRGLVHIHDLLKEGF